MSDLITIEFTLSRDEWNVVRRQLDGPVAGGPTAAHVVSVVRDHIDQEADVKSSWPGPCPCECNRGGFCGGCGHAGCGGRK